MHAVLSLLLATGAVAGDIKPPPKKSKVVVYEHLTLEDLQGLLDGQGITYETRRIEGQDTAMRIDLDGWKVVLVLGDEGRGVGDDLFLYAGFQVAEMPKPEVLNVWNATRRYVRAYIDPAGDPVIESDLDLDGGVLAGRILDHIALFRTQVAAFAQHIGFES